MSELYVSLANSFGPLVQFLFFWGLFLLFGWLICAIASWGVGRLVQTNKRTLWMLPFPLLSISLFYGCLRFSGLLVYPADGWDASGIWNYTHQNRGAFLIFLSGCLLLEAILAVCKKNRLLKRTNEV